MKVKLNGRELDVSGIRVGELCEAEKALGVTMDSGSGATIAVTLYIGLRREDKQKPPGALADEVMRADVTTVEEVEEQDPPADAPADEPTAAGALESQPTSGALV